MAGMTRLQTLVFDADRNLVMLRNSVGSGSMKVRNFSTTSRFGYAFELSKNIGTISCL